LSRISKNDEQPKAAQSSIPVPNMSLEPHEVKAEVKNVLPSNEVAAFPSLIEKEISKGSKDFEVYRASQKDGPLQVVALAAGIISTQIGAMRKVEGDKFTIEGKHQLGRWMKVIE